MFLLLVDLVHFAADRSSFYSFLCFRQAKLDAAAALKNYYKKSETYSKTEVDNLLSTNSSGDRAYAKQYTDELFGSIKFASNSDIDGLFTVAW